jgi:hypothetical protein
MGHTVDVLKGYIAKCTETEYGSVVRVSFSTFTFLFLSLLLFVFLTRTFPLPRVATAIGWKTHARSFEFE